MMLNSCQQQAVVHCRFTKEAEQYVDFVRFPQSDFATLCSIIASERGHTHVVSALLKQNANVKACTRYCEATSLPLCLNTCCLSVTGSPWSISCTSWHHSFVPSFVVIKQSSNKPYRRSLQAEGHSIALGGLQRSC